MERIEMTKKKPPKPKAKSKDGAPATMPPQKSDFGGASDADLSQGKVKRGRRTK